MRPLSGAPGAIGRAAEMSARYGLYLPPWGRSALLSRADAIERLGRRLGLLGAAFVVARAEVGAAETNP
jgi:hypothetical protein